ncbi:MAG: site-2 protease family protein [Clostridia bacterium]|nr:site-2 protease family protein [Clostridia bacterium]
MSYILVIFAVGFLILVHEVGHLLAAKWAGIPIARFSIGFGPKLWSFTKGGVEYRIALIPLGGYVLPDIEEEKDFFALAVRKRIIFSLGGPLANLVFAYPLMAIYNLLKGDMSLYALTVKPLIQVISSLGYIITAIPMLFTKPEQLSGIVGIVAQGGKMVEGDWLSGIVLLVMLNLNLLVFNLLPLPVLDGGQILLTLMEKISPKVLKIRLPLALLAWILMLGLMIYATSNDIGRLMT